jgi:hypothetical protein
MRVRSGARTGVVAMRVGAVVLVLSAALAGCSFSDHEPKETVEIWRSGDQFVRLEPPRAVLAGQPPRNAHPFWPANRRATRIR